MKILCTRPSQIDENEPPHENDIPDRHLSDRHLEQEYCCICGMPLILRYRFVPIEQIGKGGFGRTFTALDLQFKKSKRVIKQLYPKNPLSPQQRKKAEDLFEREAEVLNDLKHNQIPRIYAFFGLSVPKDSRFPAPLGNSQQEFFYLAQEYIEGRDLEQELEQEGKFSESEVLEVLRQVLEILDYIHNYKQESVIHRDIKPSNILRSKNSRKNQELHLIDFGAVRQVIQVVEENAVEGETIIGSPGFAPPEQERDGQVSFSSDLYSLAATCVCLLTGQNPGRLRVPFQLQEWQRHTVVSAKLAAILNRMLEPNPERRFESANAVLEKLYRTKLLRKRKRDRPEVWLAWIATTVIIALIARWQSVRWEPLLPGSYFSRGEEILLDKDTYDTDPDNLECQKAFSKKEKGSEDFGKGEYEQAEISFDEAVQRFKAARDSNLGCIGGDPETLIYLNNAKANQSSTAPLTIAVSIPIGGKATNTIAKKILFGVAHAQNKLNESNGIDGRLLQVIIAKDNTKDNYKDLNDPDTAQKVAEHLVRNRLKGNDSEEDEFKGDEFRGEILGVIGHYTSDSTLAAGEIYEGNMVAVSPNSTAIRTTSENHDNGFFKHEFNLTNWSFRVSPDDSTAAEELVGSLPENTKAAILYYGKSRYSRSLSAAFEKEILSEKIAEKIVSKCNFSQADQKDIAQCVSHARENDVEVLMLTLTSEVRDRFIEAVSDSAVQEDIRSLQLLGGDSFYDREVLSKLGERAVGMKLGVPWHRDFALGWFLEEARELWGEEIKYLDWKTAVSFDATQVLIEGLKRTQNPNRQSLYKTISGQGFSVEGVTGRIEFNGELDPLKRHDRLVNEENEDKLGVLVEVRERGECPSYTEDSSEDDGSNSKYDFCLLPEQP
ncbi:MAG: bifunctional serine/threonine-protein kinase/ABC transporter substrate-binding protein [Coleofasciculaceae cyanobacterium]